MSPRLLFFLLAVCAAATTKAAPAQFDLRAGDRVVFLGDGFIEGEQYQGWIELMLTTRFADRNISFRNLGWSGDTPAGDSRLGRSLLQAGKEPADEGWNQLLRQITEAKPTVVFIGYGMASSFDGAAGLTKFRADYTRLLDAVARASPGVRFVLLSPLRHENLGAPWPDPAAHNVQLASYTDAIRAIAAAQGARFVSLFAADGAASASERSPLAGARGYVSGLLTHNGIQPSGDGYRIVAQAIEDQLFGTESRSPWRTSTQLEPLRRAILVKNEWFFHQSRPQNMAYIFGFRKREQGRNAAEIAQFDQFIAAEEKRIAQMRALFIAHPANPPLANVPEIPRRIGNRNAQLTPQPHPDFVIADGLEVTLWAENPLLHKPIQMNFDPQGRLWLVSSELYPQIEPGQAATDKIVVLEDTTGAGRADRATVFAEGLLIPTGIVPGDGGAYVAQSTELLHFQDTNGDGKADVRRILLSGFGTEDTHHNLHTLRWGPDGRLYLNQSVYTRTDAETPHGVVRLKAGGTFRFDPRDERMEILYRGLVNGWGHDFDEFGNSFLTDGAGFQGINWGIPGATYRTLAPARRELQSISPGTYPKFCGIELIRSTHFPADWQGDVITADFRAHRIVRFKVSEQGAGFVTKEMPDVMRTTADSFRPIDVRLGPDGALYVADWSNPIIQHGEVDFRDPRRDKSHGRIWRVAVKGAKPLPRVDLTKLATRELLDRQLSPNAYEAEQAKRVLVERGAPQVRPELEAWTARQTTELARLQALFLEQALEVAPASSRPPAGGTPAALTSSRPPSGSRQDAGATLLGARDPRVRAAAVRALSDTIPLEQLAQLVADEHPRVRLAAVRALGSCASAKAAELALTAVERPMDPFLDYALWLTINELAEPWIAAVKNGTWSFVGREKQLEFALKAIEPALASEVLGRLVGERGVARDGSGPWIDLIGSAGGPRELRLLFDQVVRGELAAPVALRAFAALGDAGRLRGVKPPGDLTALQRFWGGRTAVSAAAGPPGEPLRSAALQLAGIWKLATLTPQLVNVATANATPATTRAAAFAALRDIGGRPVIAELKKISAGGPPLAIRREAVLTLAALELPSAVNGIIAVLKATTDEGEAQALWRSLLSIRGVANRLANELPKTELPRAVARAGLRPAREGTQHPALVSVLMKQAGLTLSNVQLSPAELQELARQALATGDAARGEFIYRRPEMGCVGCHAVGGAGGKIGPDLTSIGASAPPDYLVESLLYPSAKIKEGYHSVLIATKDGQELSGMITKETDTEILLRNAANQEVSIPTQAVLRRTSVGSLMPAGLIDSLLPEERLDLIRFLAELGKPGRFDASKGGVARAWRLYLILSGNEHIGRERVIAGDFSLADWRPALGLVDGTLAREVAEEVIPARFNNRGMFAATQFESPQGGHARFVLGGTVKGLWVNGALVNPAAQFTAPTKPGVNTVVLQLDDREPGPVRLSSGDVTFSTQ